MLLDVLKKYWKYDAFRQQQENIMQAVLQKKNCLVIMPTGGGKSLCYQVPTMLMEGICIVITPLVALMKDQVTQLQNRGISAYALHAGLSFNKTNRILKLAQQQKIKFLYVSPERIQSELFFEEIIHCNICLIAIDEAHCISQWGYDFRPAYLEIKKICQYFISTPIIALTASATKEVRSDILFHLEMKEPQIFQQSYARPNLAYYNYEGTEKIQKLFLVINKNPKKSGLVYCATRKQCEEIAKILQAQNISANYYHAGLETTTRNKIQDDWVANKIFIIVCTNAFGMGIDKADVRFVVHYEIPNSIESYYQEAGRAGRDSQKSVAVLLHSEKDFENALQKIEKKYPSISVIKKVYVGLNNFYKIAIESGQFLQFDYNIENILPLFKDIDLYNILGAIEILEQFKIISVIENPRQPARLNIVCSKEYVQEFQKQVPALKDLIDYILRNIAHAWHDESYIFLESISKNIKFQLLNYIENY